jgi:lipopolysaccharide export system protein LptC
MKDLSARLQMEDGPAVLSAGQGRFDRDSEKVMIDGPVQFEAANGYRLSTRDVDVDLKSKRMTSQGGVDGRLPIGSFSADHLEADLDARTVALSGRVHLLIQQNRSRGRR